MSETVKLEPGPAFVGQSHQFRTFTDLMAEALAFAHAEVGTDAHDCAEFVLRLLDSKGLVLGPKRLQFQADGTMRPIFITPRDPLPDFRTFLKGRAQWPPRHGEHYEDVFATLADALAGYADEIRKRSGC